MARRRPPKKTRSPRLFGKRPFDTQYVEPSIPDPASEAQQLRELVAQKNMLHVQSRGIGKYFRTR